MGCRELLYLDLALENTVRAAAERGSGASGTGAAALMAPLLQNLVLSAGDNEELAYCLKAWQALPDTVKTGRYPAKDDALKVQYFQLLFCLHRAMRVQPPLALACIKCCVLVLVCFGRRSVTVLLPLATDPVIDMPA